MYAQFEAALAELEEGNQRIFELNQQRNSLSSQHKHCREQEALFCVGKITCDYHLWDLWKIFVDEERDLRSIEGSIDGHFCVQDEDGYYTANGTLWHFRDTSVPYMTSFISQKVRVDTAEVNYDDHRPECERRWITLDEKTDVCDALQLSLERAACSHASAIRDVQNTYAQAWNFALFSYNTTVHEVKLQEIDRINEWSTLTVVECLLHRTSERNGRPCEESTNEITEEVASCEQNRTNLNTTWLHLTYPVVTGCLQPCPDRHQVVGRCWPDAPSWPCQGQYINEEYASLPAVPMPVFSETNSHCNPRPDCESCTGIGDVPDVHLCTSQWSLTNYELCSCETVTPAPPAPPPTNEQDPLAVCPAGWEQKGGAGADIGGCGLQSCGERYDLTSEAACATRCEEHSTCVGFSYAPMNGDRNHPGVTACTIYNSDVPTGTWTGTQGIATQVFCGREVEVECGELPQLMHAAWVSTLNGMHHYRCEEGFSFDRTAQAQALTFDVECLADGRWTEPHICLPIDDCVGHSCGAFGTCSDMHMDYTCQCVDGYELATTDNGEKVCGNIDDCDGHLCGAAGVCVDLVSTYECHCQDGWQEVTMEITDVKTCEKVECGDAPQIDNVLSTTSDIWSTTSPMSGIFPWTRGKAVFEDVVEYTCAPGYTTNGMANGIRTFSIVCQADGTYTDPQQCIPISCGAPEPAGGGTPISDEVLHFGETVEYSCPVGHGPDLFQRLCLPTGQLSPAIACEPKLCPPPPALRFAAPPTGGNYFFGQTAEYSCLEGYSLTNAGQSGQVFEVECLANGWDISTIGCVPVQCEVTPDETHARSDRWFISYPGLGITQVLCADGYTVDGSADGAIQVLATCSHTGVAELASCRMVTCSGEELEEAPHSDVAIQDHPLGSSATYTCHDGHAVALTFAATFEVQCLRTGFFSALSTCRNINDCEGHSCGSNGHCVDGINDYTCVCEEGFEEVLSASGEKECGNIDDCGPNACGPQGACHDLVNAYACECEHGYELHGTGVDQICEAVICPAPDLENLAEPVPEMQFPDSLVVACAEGYSAGSSGGKSMSAFPVECSADGTHTSRGTTPLPECRPKVCGQPPDVGAEHVEMREYFYGEQVVSICEGGDVTIIHVCAANGQFQVESSSEYYTCHNVCDPSNIGPAGSSLTAPPIDQLPVHHPGSVEFTCPEGSTPLESGEPGHPVELACRANGQFEPLPTGVSHCREVVCERPQVPTNWEWINPQGDFHTGLPCFLRCMDGYQSSQAGSDGTYQITCNADGSTDGMPTPCVAATFSITGHARNAVNPTITIPGAVVTISGLNEPIIADARGYYSFAVPAGQYHYTATAGGFITVENGAVHVTGPAVFDIIMSPVLAATDWRVVLEWSDTPRDLDSHLVFHGNTYRCPEIYYGNSRTECNGVEVSLDWDEMWGHGPETVTIASLGQCQPGMDWSGYWYCKYVYKVKNWTAYEWRMTEGWVESEAKVRLFNGDRLVREFKVNDGHGYQASHGGYDDSHAETDYYWSVFSLDADGTVAECSNSNCE